MMVWEPNRDYHRDFPPVGAPVRRWRVSWGDEKGRLHTKSFKLRTHAEAFAKQHPSIITDRWAL